MFSTFDGFVCDQNNVIPRCPEKCHNGGKAVRSPCWHMMGFHTRTWCAGVGRALDQEQENHTQLCAAYSLRDLGQWPDVSELFPSSTEEVVLPGTLWIPPDENLQVNVVFPTWPVGNSRIKITQDPFSLHEAAIQSVRTGPHETVCPRVPNDSILGAFP